MASYFYYDTPVGKLIIAESDNRITHVLFEGVVPPKGYTLGETPSLTEAYKQLQEYFNGNRREFDLDLDPSGTEFMKSVWTSLQKIPYGETRSYKDIAVSIGKDKAYRAVGSANNKNPISIIIPCHRVVGAKGDLIGYGGGLNIKTFLLDLEKSY